MRKERYAKLIKALTVEQKTETGGIKNEAVCAYQ
jgi:hypothetical protein